MHAYINKFKTMYVCIATYVRIVHSNITCVYTYSPSGSQQSKHITTDEFTSTNETVVVYAISGSPAADVQRVSN